MWRPARALGVLRVPGGDDHENYNDDEDEYDVPPMLSSIYQVHKRWFTIISGKQIIIVVYHDIKKPKDDCNLPWYQEN